NKINSYLKKKNLHDFYKLAKTENYGESLIKAFEVAVTGEGDAEKVLSLAESVVLNDEMFCAVEELENLVKSLQKFGFGGKININFAASANADYYNGVIFNGYLQGIPHCVLSGGRYDKLLNKFGKQGGAIGFAIYLGEIERYLSKDEDCVDYLIIYNASTQDKALEFAQKTLCEGKSVRLANKAPAGFAYNAVVDFTKEAGK
ncbi:MAG: ATP phosphoribosyltransferase regulatory subunit, partial [Clostridia bacterium]|nr:ATP phosphoribosyltransferase regulatory subunit [Clostridia bacterium]